MYVHGLFSICMGWGGGFITPHKDLVQTLSFTQATGLQCWLFFWRASLLFLSCVVRRGDSHMWNLQPWAQTSGLPGGVELHGDMGPPVLIPVRTPLSLYPIIPVSREPSGSPPRPAASCCFLPLQHSLPLKCPILPAGTDHCILTLPLTQPRLPLH